MTLFESNRAVFSLLQSQSGPAKTILDVLIKGSPITCKELYHYDHSCSERLIPKAILVATALLKINLPIHILPLLFRLKNLKSQPWETTKNFVKNLFKSVAFLTTFVMSLTVIQCCGGRLSHKLSTTEEGNYGFGRIRGRASNLIDDAQNSSMGKNQNLSHANSIPIWSYVVQWTFVACVVAGLGIIWERPMKRLEIIYFCLPRTTEAVTNMMNKRRAYFPFKGEEIVTFAVAVGILAACSYREELRKHQVRGWSNKFISQILNDQNEQKKSRVEMLQEKI